MQTNNKLSNQKLFNVGVRLVKFAWVIEILAISIGFLISIIVSYSVYAELNKTDKVLDFGDYSSILVSALPFVLVAVVEAAKIPVATALMYAKHFTWRCLFFLGLVLLATITFETMLNGFERNFSGLNISIDEQKNESLLLQDKVDVLQARKNEINIINLDTVDGQYRQQVGVANTVYKETLASERQRINKKMATFNNKTNDSKQYYAEIEGLNTKERNIYESWDKERNQLQDRIRSLLNNYVSGTKTDKQKLQKELDALKAEMEEKVEDASFFTSNEVEKKYRKLIKDKEARLYSVADRSTGSGALDQQTQSEKQLQDQVQVLGKDYQKRIDMGRSRIAYLEEKILESTTGNDKVLKNYKRDLTQITKQTEKLRQNSVFVAKKEKNRLAEEYDAIQIEVDAINLQIYDISLEQTVIRHNINRLVNSNQIYRLAAYIDNKDQAIDVPKSTVGLVAMVWFSSLAFISAITGVFLAIAGIYTQRIYSENDDFSMSPQKVTATAATAAVIPNPVSVAPPPEK